MQEESLKTATHRVGTPPLKFSVLAASYRMGRESLNLRGVRTLGFFTPKQLLGGPLQLGDRTGRLMRSHELITSDVNLLSSVYVSSGQECRILAQRSLAVGGCDVAVQCKHVAS